MTTPDLATRVGRLEKRAETRDDDFRALSESVVDVIDRLDDLTVEVRAGFAASNARMDGLTDRFDGLTGRVDDLSQTVDQHTATLDQHTAILDQHTATLDQHTGMLTEILGILRASGPGDGRADPSPPTGAR